MEEHKPDRTEMWKALKWTAILLVALLVAIGIFKAWQVVTSPARAIETATENVKSGASGVLNRLDVPIKKHRSFDRLADAAFAHLNEMSPSEPKTVKDRGFRMANFRGAENRVCETVHDFGVGEVPVFVAGDNSAHEAAKTVGSNANRLIRIVIASPEETLGLNAEYDESNGNWSLSWRTSSINKPYPDEWAEKPISAVLKSVPKACLVSTE
jgi:hypothetical protein